MLCGSRRGKSIEANGEEEKKVEVMSFADRLNREYTKYKSKYDGGDRSFGNVLSHTVYHRHRTAPLY